MVATQIFFNYKRIFIVCFKMQNKKFDWLARFEQIPSRIYVFLAIFALTLDTLLCAFTSIDPVICGTVTISVYAVVSLTIYLFTLCNNTTTSDFIAIF